MIFHIFLLSPSPSLLHRFEKQLKRLRRDMQFLIHETVDVTKKKIKRIKTTRKIISSGKISDPEKYQKIRHRCTIALSRCCFIGWKTIELMNIFSNISIIRRGLFVMKLDFAFFLHRHRVLCIWCTSKQTFFWGGGDGLTANFMVQKTHRNWFLRSFSSWVAKKTCSWKSFAMQKFSDDIRQWRISLDRSW